MWPALLAIVLLLSATPSAWGQGFDRQTLLRVLLTADASQVAGCTRLGATSDTSPEDLRKKILRMAGDAGLVTFDQFDPDKINAEVFRCQKRQAAPQPAAVAPADPTAAHQALLGTWVGTLRMPPPPLGRGTGGGPTVYAATLEVAEEGGALRWTMAVDGGPAASGTVTHYFSDITLTGTQGTDGSGINYALKLNGQNLDGTGVGPDQLLRTVSLRKRR